MREIASLGLSSTAASTSEPPPPPAVVLRNSSWYKPALLRESDERIQVKPADTYVQLPGFRGGRRCFPMRRCFSGTHLRGGPHGLCIGKRHIYYVAPGLRRILVRCSESEVAELERKQQCTACGRFGPCDGSLPGLSETSLTACPCGEAYFCDVECHRRTACPHIEDTSVFIGLSNTEVRHQERIGPRCYCSCCTARQKPAVSRPTTVPASITIREAGVQRRITHEQAIICGADGNISVCCAPGRIYGGPEPRRHPTKGMQGTRFMMFPSATITDFDWHSDSYSPPSWLTQWHEQIREYSRSDREQPLM